MIADHGIRIRFLFAGTEKKMKKRSRIGLGLSLAIALSVGPQLTLATAAKRLLRNEATEIAKRVAGPASNSIKPVRRPFSSKLLMKRPTQDASATVGQPGQTSTLL